MNLLLASSPVKNNTIKPLGPETDPALGSKLSHYRLMCSAEPVNKLPALQVNLGRICGSSSHKIIGASS